MRGILNKRVGQSGNRLCVLIFLLRGLDTSVGGRGGEGLGGTVYYAGRVAVDMGVIMGEKTHDCASQAGFSGGTRRRGEGRNRARGEKDTILERVGAFLLLSDRIISSILR